MKSLRQGEATSRLETGTGLQHCPEGWNFKRMRLILNETCTQALFKPKNRPRPPTLPTLTYHTHSPRPFSYSGYGNQGHNVHLLLEGPFSRLYSSGL